MLPIYDRPRRRSIRYLAAACALITPGTALCKDGFDGWGSVRVRAEAVGNRVQPEGATDDFAVQTRVILGGSYRTGRLKLTAEMRDARSFFQKTDSVIGEDDVNALEPMQYHAAIDIGEAAEEGAGATLTGGRFLLDIGSNRLISASNWSNTATSFTGAKAELHDADGRRALLFWAMPHQKLPTDKEAIRDNAARIDRVSPAVQLYGIWSEIPVASDFKLELYAYRLDERDSAGRETADRRLLTPGIRLHRQPRAGTFDVDVEAIGQWGRAHASRAATDKDDRRVAATFVHAEAGYTLAHSAKPRLALLVDRGSGAREGGRHTRFDHLYGTRSDLNPTSFYGPLNRANIIAPGIKLTADPGKHMSIALTGRGLWLDSATDSFAQTGVRDRSGAAGRFAGAQIEGAIKHKFGDGWMLEAGGAYLARGRFLRAAPNARDGGDSLFAYSDISFSF